MATAVLHQQHCTTDQIPFAPISPHCPCSRSKPPASDRKRNSHRRRRQDEKNTGRRRKEKMMNPVKEMGNNESRILKLDENLSANMDENVIVPCSTDQAPLVASSKQIIIAVRQEKIKAADHNRFAGYVYTPPHPSSLPMPMMMDLCHEKKKKKKFDHNMLNIQKLTVVDDNLVL